MEENQTLTKYEVETQIDVVTSLIGKKVRNLRIIVIKEIIIKLL